MVSQNDNTPTSQITLSQYEYRVARLPKRDYTRRRRHRQQLTASTSQLLIDSEADLLVVPSSETIVDDADEHQLLNVRTPESKRLIPHTPQPERITAQQHFHSSQIPNITNSSHLKSHEDAVLPAPSSSMPMQMPMDDDDRELLRLASPCDSDVPSRDNDESRSLRSKTRVLTPESSTTSRRSVDSSYTEQLPNRPVRRAKKKKINKLSDLNLLGNQLVMVASGPEDTMSYNDEPKSSIDDDIEDSQLYGPPIKKPRIVSEVRKTVSGTQLRRKYNQKLAKSASEQFTTPARKRIRDLCQDVGDGFDVDERTMVISVSRSHRLPKSRPRARTHAITVPSLEVGLASNQVASPSELHDSHDTMASIETTEVTLSEEIEDDHEPGHVGSILKMAATMRENALLQTSKRPKIVSRAPISRRHDQQLQTPLTMSTSTRAHENSAQHSNTSRQTSKKAYKTCKSPRSGMPHFSTAASRGDGFSAGPAQAFETDFESPTPALSRPGNLSMMSNLHYDEAEEEPIEDDNPPQPRPSYYATSAISAGARPLLPSKSMLNITPRRAMDALHPEAAYPTPQTTARVSAGERSKNGSPLKPFDLRVSRGQYGDLADDMIKDDAGENATEEDSGYSRPNTAGKVWGSTATQSTQVARNGMAFDDNSEVLWDGSMRSSTFGSTIPQAISRKASAGRSTSRATAVNATPRTVKLKQLTRIVSRHSGTLSPEKAIQRRTSSLSTFKAPFKPQVERKEHEPMMSKKKR